MPDEPSGLSRSVEDYLKAIYALSESGEVASTSAIAEALDVQPASVTGMVKRLAETGFLKHAPYKGVQLTSTGAEQALRILRRHRILETYLTERLRYPWEAVHREAERLEHAASEELIERMSEALGNPSHDPHGAPIPTRAGEIENTDSFTLAELGAGVEAQVRAVRDDDFTGLRGAEAAGLLPGTRVLVRQRSYRDGLLMVEVGDRGTPPQEVGFEVAHRVFVVALPPDHTWREPDG
jgi:DtxR family Mn-dependent transcriptional regulator